LPQERLSMRKFKEVVRLHSLGLTQRQIARSCSIAQSTVHEYLKAAAEAGVSWPLPGEWNERQLEGALTKKPRQARRHVRPPSRTSPPSAGNSRPIPTSRCNCCGKSIAKGIRWTGTATAVMWRPYLCCAIMSKP